MPRLLIPLVLMAVLAPALAAQIVINRLTEPVTLWFRKSPDSALLTCTYDPTDPVAKILPGQIFSPEVAALMEKMFPSRPQKLNYRNLVVFEVDTRDPQGIPDNHRKEILTQWLISQGNPNPTVEKLAKTSNQQQWTFESNQEFSSDDRSFQREDPIYKVGDIKIEEVLRLLVSQPPLQGKDVALGGKDKVSRFDQYRLAPDAANNRWLLWYRAPDAVSNISRAAQHSALSSWFVGVYNAADATSAGQGVYKVEEFSWKRNQLSRAQIAAQMSSYLRSQKADNPSYDSGSVTLSGYEQGWYVIRVSFEDRRRSTPQTDNDKIVLDALGTRFTYKGKTYPLEDGCYKKLNPYRYRIGYEIK